MTAEILYCAQNANFHTAKVLRLAFQALTYLKGCRPPFNPPTKKTSRAPIIEALDAGVV